MTKFGLETSYFTPTTPPLRLLTWLGGCASYSYNSQSFIFFVTSKTLALWGISYKWWVYVWCMVYACTLEATFKINFS